MTYVIRYGLFYRIILSDGRYISKNKFWRLSSAVKYMDMMDKHGVPVEEYKGKK